MLSTLLRSRDDIASACEALREADRLTAAALSILARTDVEARTGLPAEMMLMLDARRTPSDARMLTNAAATLRAMPATDAAFARGDLSWGQVRAICAAVRSVDARGRLEVDSLVGSLAGCLRDADPDELVCRVDDAVARLRADLALHREDRAIERGFLAVQGRLDGGGSFYGEADPESLATMLEALDAVAASPVDPDGQGAPSRAQQRFDALIGICEASLGGDQTTRPRPRLIASVDMGYPDAARILWSLAGRPARITPLATAVLGCDANVIPVFFDGARPVAVGDASSPISTKMRSALIARDQGCRFPGCGAPVSWCDAHHIRARINDGPTVIDNLVLLCRRCHRRVHRFRWCIVLEQDGTMTFARRGKTFTSNPRAHPPPRE